MKLHYNALRVGRGIVRLLRRLRVHRMRPSRVVDECSMRLNYDVLGHIMRFLGGQDLVNIMCTSRASYEVGLSILLGQPIHLYAKHTLPFVDFILKDPPRYGPMLRNLTVAQTYIDKLDCQLATVVEHASHLRRFSIYGMMSSSSDTPELLKTLLTRPSKELRQVGLPSISSRYPPADFPLHLDYLKSVSWPSLVHLQLKVYLELGDYGWLDALSRFSLTLETLERSTAEFKFPSTFTIPFPRLRTLCIYTILYPDEEAYFPTMRLVHLFPQLQNLYVDQIHAEIPPLTVEAHRERNIQDAVALSRNHGYWPNLVHVCTAYDAMYTMGLKCPVRHLDLSHSYYYDHMWQSEEVAKAIRDLQPCALSFGLPLTRAACHTLSTILVDSAQLTHLEYELTFDNDDPKSSLKSLGWFLVCFLVSSFEQAHI
ncbi:hypothetical protein K474DRAFT_759119 [Panus rudis PR-1116 ss-1]|nr:hypothetical protein K474DRAFT_759119 [Panus rudis PR-1116 ss-1]